MGRFYTSAFASVAHPAAAQDYFELLAPAANSVIIHSIRIAQSSEEGDAQAEDEVLRGIRDQRGGAAAVLISHRLSTMRLADRIFVLEQGRIIQRGTHTELIEQAGTYARLFNLQASAYRKDRGPS